MTSNPISDLRLPESKKNNRKHLPTKEDIDEFASRPDPYSYVGIRDRALIRLCYSCPLRTSDYKNLNVKDVDLEKRLLLPKVHDKRYENGIPLDEEVIQALGRYLKVSRPVFLKKAKVCTDRLFLNEWGEPFYPSSIFDIFHRYRGDKRIHPYAMRHARAIEMLQRGSGIKEIKALLGLKSNKSIRGYLTVIDSDLKNLYRKYHPLKKTCIRWETAGNLNTIYGEKA